MSVSERLLVCWGVVVTTCNRNGLDLPPSASTCNRAQPSRINCD
ncbi:Integrase catalytic subunit [Pseudomonas amygdali pv. myricae]|nr:Integrase catalytic subunit [Pseudomonas amygdali pv. myricae]RMT47445.1 hypothetical protein ALP46_01082 [Pseudomonas amygdali pv. myricae]